MTKPVDTPPVMAEDEAMLPWPFAPDELGEADLVEEFAAWLAAQGVDSSLHRNYVALTDLPGFIRLLCAHPTRAEELADIHATIHDVEPMAWQRRDLICRIHGKIDSVERWNPWRTFDTRAQANDAMPDLPQGLKSVDSELRELYTRPTEPVGLREPEGREAVIAEIRTYLFNRVTAAGLMDGDVRRRYAEQLYAIAQVAAPPEAGLREPDYYMLENEDIAAEMESAWVGLYVTVEEAEETRSGVIAYRLEDWEEGDGPRPTVSDIHVRAVWVAAPPEASVEQLQKAFRAGWNHNHPMNEPDGSEVAFQHWHAALTQAPKTGETP